ncbi:membrane protein [Caballeronia arationis]|jgi:hypothetical protein|uniref:Purine nucleoside phosphorylase n=1 Tax=Caballeronia arationis TaxID=1777142 RepID=A0A7Z7N5R7_9BURK|nr:DUF4148 domain-containing protein [Caballeronia arationis]SAK72359.1 membrane protein [Caballeronia arationis]SOE88122.1 protein of unknown function [Caballeronia arationis]
MKTVASLALSAMLLVSSGAFAEGLTRAEVRAQLVAAEQNGSRLVTDASYPDVSPFYQNQLAQRPNASVDADVNSYGGAMTGSASGAARAMGTCVGPVSFCNIYAGS